MKEQFKTISCSDVVTIENMTAHGWRAAFLNQNYVTLHRVLIEWGEMTDIATLKKRGIWEQLTDEEKERAKNITWISPPPKSANSQSGHEPPAV